MRKDGGTTAEAQTGILRENGLALLLLATVAFVVFYKVFLHPTEMLWGEETARFHAAQQATMWRSVWLEHALPFWDRTLFCGHPNIYAEAPSVVSPVVIAPGVVSTPAAFGIYFFLQVLLASWGMFLLLRVRGCEAFGAFFGALAFAFGGKVMAHVFAGHVGILPVFLQTPWSLWSLERLLRKPDAVEVLVVALIAAALVSVGSLSAAVLVGGFAILYMLVASLERAE